MKAIISSLFPAVFFLCSLIPTVAMSQSSPVNDDPCGAIPITCDMAPLNGSFANSTPSGANVCPNPLNVGDVWFTFESDGISTYHISASTSPATVNVALYAGNDCSDLSLAWPCLGGGNETITAQLPAGTYYFLVRPINSSPSNSQYRIRLGCASAPPVNDEPCGALPLDCPSGVVHGNTLMATSSMNTGCFYNGAENDVWYTFDADGVSSYMIVETARALGAMQLFRADACDGPFTVVEPCETWANLGNFQYFSGVYDEGTYYLRIMNNQSGAGRVFSINLFCSPQPDNDELCDATPISCGETLSGTTTGANPDDPGVCHGVPTAPGVWYTYTPEVSGFANFSLCNQANFDTKMTLYQASDCNSELNCITGNNNYVDGTLDCGKTSHIPNVEVEAGQTYYILVHGTNIATGNFALTVDCAGGVQGCTDVQALNYDPEATIDDGNCIYANTLACGEFVEGEHCYANNDESLFAYASSDGSPLTVVFTDGVMDESDVIRVYDGFNLSTATLLFDYDSIATYDWLFENPNMSGYTFVGTSGGIIIEFDAWILSGSCADLDVPPVKWLVGCGADTPIVGCTDPDAVNFDPSATIFDFSCVYPVANDEPCGAFQISCNAPFVVAYMEGSTLSAEVADDECENPGEPSVGDVWYKFRSDGQHLYSITATSGYFAVALFAGDDCGNLTQVGSCQQQGSPNSISGYFETGTYYFSIRPATNAPQNLTAQVYLGCSIPPPAPENDEICDAMELICNGPITPVNMGGASASVEDDPCGNIGGQDVWYTFEADGVSNYRVELVNAPQDHSISLYRAASCGGPFEEILQCQSGSPVIEGVFETGTYYVRDRFDYPVMNTETRSIVALTCGSAGPNNDEPCGAFALDCTQSKNDLMYGTFTGATESAGYPDGCGTTTGDVWLSFEAAETGVYTIRQNYPTPAARLAVYRGDDCTGSFTPILNCSSFSYIVPLTINQTGTYYIKLLKPSNSNVYAIRVECPTEPPSNDLACNAIDIDCTTDMVTGSNIGATPDPICTNCYGSGVWYRYVSDIFGTVTLNTCDIQTTLNDVLVVYTGSDCGDLGFYAWSTSSAPGCNGHTSLTFDVVPNENYYILVSGYLSSTGTFGMSISCDEAVPDCSAINADIGDTCDDGNDETYADAVNEDCQCEGKPYPSESCGSFSRSPNMAFGSDWNVKTDSMAISGTGGFISDMDVVLVVNHSRVSEVRARLISPEGTVVHLLAASCIGTNIDVRLDDDGGGPSKCTWSTNPDEPDLIGVYKPQSPLHYLNGQSLNGTWKLEINDTYPIFHPGTLVSWCLVPTLSEFECLDLEANIGDPCDDGNPDTEDDAVTEDCECVGTPICQAPYPAVTGMVAQAISNGMLLTWNPIPGSIGCQHRLKKMSTGEMILQHYQQEFEASEILAPPYLFQYGTDYEWRIRCGCQEYPVIAGPWSTLTFTTPSAPTLSSFPNPTSRTSSVSFRVVFPERATLEVFDLNGRRIAEVFSGEASPEMEMSFVFDASELPQGVYLYRLTTESASVIDKFMIAR